MSAIISQVNPCKKARSYWRRAGGLKVYLNAIRKRIVRDEL